MQQSNHKRGRSLAGSKSLEDPSMLRLLVSYIIATLLCVFVLAVTPASAQASKEATKGLLDKWLNLPVTSKPAKPAEKPVEAAPAPAAPTATPPAPTTASAPEKPVEAAPPIEVKAAARKRVLAAAKLVAHKAAAKKLPPAVVAILDHATQSPEFGAPAPLWTGYHVGASAGYGARGAIGGAQLGYSLRYGKAWAGVEGDFSGVSTSADWLATTRVRVGYIALPDLLVYGTGGLAFGPAQSWDGAPKVARVGWTAGGGVEWAIFGSPVSVKAEYLHYDLGVRTLELQALAQQSIVFGPRLDVARSWGDIVRLGVNYRFGGAADAAILP